VPRLYLAKGSKTFNDFTKTVKTTQKLLDVLATVLLISINTSHFFGAISKQVSTWQLWFCCQVRTPMQVSWAGKSSFIPGCQELLLLFMASEQVQHTPKTKVAVTHLLLSGENPIGEILERKIRVRVHLDERHAEHWAVPAHR